MEAVMDRRNQHVETTLTPGRSCQRCPEGTYAKGTVTETLERGDTVVVVKDVPALVCDVCGNSLLGAEEVDRLQTILDQAIAEGIELESRTYQPAPQPHEEPSRT
jgi:YgiT-type zinc finger domain-containing protein